LVKCTKCGAENFDGAERCLECGERLGGEGAVRGGRADAGTKPDSPSRSTIVLLATIALVAMIGFGMFLSAGSSGGGGRGSGGNGAVTATSSLLPQAQLPSEVASSVASEATSDFEMNKAKDYSRFYGRLAESDRKRVTEENWVARSRVFEQMNGSLESYSIVKSSFMDPGQAIVAVTAQVKYSRVKEPVLVEVHYVQQGGAWVPSMLWGRTVNSVQASVGATP
jgi:hypothetical protein